MIGTPHDLRPVMLVILDGWGLSATAEDNAVRQASTPTFDRLWGQCPHATLRTSGSDVGLPDGQMGNSEVGHLNIGAGRVVMQDLPRISRAAAEGNLAQLPGLKALADTLAKSGGAAHLLGLVSPGGVHSHQDHAVALCEALEEAGIPVRLHVVTDGRDTPPQSGADHVRALLSALPRNVSVATVSGRFYAMDRDHRWERVAQAYDAIALGSGAWSGDPVATIAESYGKGVTDEFVVPTVIGDYAGMRDGDGLICFNFRADRVRELLSALLDAGFGGFTRSAWPRLAVAAGLTSYGAELDPLMLTLFAPQNLDNVLGETVAKAGRAQLRMAESEKYPHVTYFLNGGRETPYKGEDRIVVPSPKVATYDLQPEMSAGKLTDKAVEAIASGKYDLIVLNFANPDMVGHTGNLAAAIKAVETVDVGLGRILDAVRDAGGALLVTADHGNCELMRDPATGAPHTAHTTNPVPVILAGVDGATLRDGRLADLAPTLLALIGIAKPAEMTGASLLL